MPLHFVHRAPEPRYPVGRDLAVVFDTLALAGASRALLWDDNGGSGKSTQLLWNLLAHTTLNSTLRWNDTGVTPPTFSAAVTASGASFSSSLTFNLTSTGTNELIIACCAANGGVGTGTALLDGVAMTHLGQYGSGGGGVCFMDVWYAVGATGGSHTVLWNTTSSGNIAGTCLAYSGVNQTTPLGTVGTFASGGATSASTSVSASGAVVLSAINVYGATGSVTPGGSQTTRGDAIGNGQTHAVATDQAGGASVTSSFSWSGSDPVIQVSIPLNGM